MTTPHITAGYRDDDPLSAISWTVDGREEPLTLAVLAADRSRRRVLVRRHLDLLRRTLEAADRMADEIAGTDPADDLLPVGVVEPDSWDHARLELGHEALRMSALLLADFVVEDANRRELGLLAADHPLASAVALMLSGALNCQAGLNSLVRKDR